jgi:hypothetical protein
MKYFLILWLGGLFLLFVPNLNAGSIYTWTDQNGVKRYSNAAPNQDPKDVKVINEIPHTQADEEKSRQTSEKLEQVLEEPKAEEIEREQKNKLIDTGEKKTAIDTLNKKVLIEKERLQNEIRRIEQLATGFRRVKGKPISNSFSLAMKKSKIKEYQDKLDLLERSPEEYFGTSTP